MAISWGAWEYSSGNGMRVGLDVSWEAISHAEAAATATIRVYTENQYNYSDNQVLSYGGAIGGTTSYTNNDGGAAQLRATKSYTYNYPAGSYGSSPGNRTFSASVSGAYNGVTPSKSVTSAIPARPYGAPAAPTSVAASRLSDTSHTVSWVNHSTSGEPWGAVWVDRSVDGGGWVRATNAGGGATSYTDTSTSANHRYQWRVAADNSVGTSAWVYTATKYTTPAAPTNAVRTASGADQVITWTNNASTGYLTEVWHAVNGVWDSSALATVAAGVATYTHVAPSTTAQHKYRVRASVDPAVQATPYLASADSNETTSTTGTLVTSPPNAPTGLSPSGTVVAIGSTTTFSWTHNPTDGTGQTAFDFQWRYAGDLTWNASGKITSGTSSTTVAANTFTADSTIEWQVRTYGSDVTPGPYSGTVSFSTSTSTTRANLRPVFLNIATASLEAAPPGVGIIPYMGPTLAPSAYPVGVTTFPVDSQTGWPTTQGIVETVSHTNDRIVQRFTERDTANTYQRVGQSDVWTNWTELGGGDTGWLTSGFSIATGFTDSATRYRKLGKNVQIDMDGTWSGSDLTIQSNGNIVDTSLFTLPSGYIPSKNVFGSGHHAGFAHLRLWVTTTGLVQIIGGDCGVGAVLSGQAIMGTFVYMVD